MLINLVKYKQCRVVEQIVIVRFRLDPESEPALYIRVLLGVLDPDADSVALDQIAQILTIDDLAVFVDDLELTGRSKVVVVGDSRLNDSLITEEQLSVLKLEVALCQTEFLCSF